MVNFDDSICSINVDLGGKKLTFYKSKMASVNILLSDLKRIVEEIEK